MDRKERSCEVSLAIVGSTASGKSALALAAAKRFGGEIISVDSMQIYRTMDIGTAKPTADELLQVRHHMIDVCSPFTPMSAADFAPMALECAAEISARGALPIFCGGTGLYLDAVLFGGSFDDTPSDPLVREKWNAIAAERGAQYVHDALLAVDPESAAAIHPNNVKRAIRALEIYECCGVPKSELDRRSRERGLCYDARVIGLRYRSRELLYSRIDRRVDIMMADGLLDETRRLLDEGVFERNTTAAQAIGYKELLGYLRGECTLDEATGRLKLATRHYAKRQMTWFSAKSYVRWIDADDGQGNMRDFDVILADAMSACGGVGV
ncbi:MAG: tRNA (adenosine(37)-N6)-dimethylallyltransferase MiaA [Clostridia bacterium]|nr:tRNA (adenosine(37)-N6)-dimethylallyltransferase MiaA [Clostridia bacterium]